MGRVTVQPAERLLWRKSRQEGENVMELSILIVDDDKILVDKLEETVNWEKIGISMVFTAYNIRQAQKLLKEFPIQFLLCDIDMPQGSGLELLEWIRDNQMEIECVFLSSYANFAYAQKALRLSTREYLLKPISNQDLEAVLSRIIEETREKESGAARPGTTPTGRGTEKQSSGRNFSLILRLRRKFLRVQSRRICIRNRTGLRLRQLKFLQTTRISTIRKTLRCSIL